jgi:P-type E1-E2 ATPase
MDRLAALFTLGLFGMAFVTAVAFLALGSPAEGLRRALALLILACPCGLALAAPLTVSFAIRGTQDLGIWLKRFDLLDEAAEANVLFVDKTGTLTNGRVELELDFLKREHPVSEIPPSNSVESSIRPRTKKICPRRLPSSKKNLKNSPSLLLIIPLISFRQRRRLQNCGQKIKIAN